MRFYEIVNEDLADDTIGQGSGMTSPLGPNAKADMAQASTNDAAKINPTPVKNDPNNRAATQAAIQQNNPNQVSSQAGNQNNQNQNNNPNATPTQKTATGAPIKAPVNPQVTNNLQAGKNIKLPLGPNKAQQQFKVGAVDPNNKTVTLANPTAKQGQPLAQVYSSNDVNDVLNVQGNK